MIPASAFVLLLLEKIALGSRTDPLQDELSRLAKPDDHGLYLLRLQV